MIRAGDGVVRPGAIEIDVKFAGHLAGTPPPGRVVWGKMRRHGSAEKIRSGYGTISVPMPVFVKISSSSACGVRPSMK